MSKKTRSYKRHRKHKTHKAHKVHKKHKAHKRHTRRRLYRKRREIMLLPGSKGIPMFSVPEQNQVQKIFVNQSNKESGNIIPGLRKM